ISPGLAIFMSFILFGMIFSTAVSMFFEFPPRFVEMRTTKSNFFVFITVFIGFIASFVGFTDLIASFCPLNRYLGLFFIGALIYAPFKLAKDNKQRIQS